MYDTWRGSDVDNMPPKEGEWGQEHLYGPWQVLVHVGSHQWHACRGAWAAGDLNAASPRERTGMIHHDPHRHLSLNIKTNKDRWYWYCMMSRLVKMVRCQNLVKHGQCKNILKHDLYNPTTKIIQNSQYSSDLTLLQSSPRLSNISLLPSTPCYWILTQVETEGQLAGNTFAHKLCHINQNIF